MNARRLSISLPPATEDLVRAAADAADMSVSAWIAQAAESAATAQTARAEAIAALEEFESENGPIDLASIRRATAELMAAGVFEPRQATG